MRPAGVLVIVLLAVGCSDGPKLVPVSGKVTVEGKPVANLLVSFEPIGSQENLYPGRGSTGVTDANGIYTLSTVPKRQPGAIVGKHRVRIVLLSGGDGRAEDRNATGKAGTRAASESRYLPRRFNDETILDHTVPPAGTDQANFDLTWQ